MSVCWFSTRETVALDKPDSFGSMNTIGQLPIIFNNPLLKRSHCFINTQDLTRLMVKILEEGRKLLCDGLILKQRCSCLPLVIAKYNPVRVLFIWSKSSFVARAEILGFFNWFASHA